MQRIILVCAALVLAVTGQGIGTQFSRTALLYENLPLNVVDAISSGWYNYTDSSCDSNLGIPYTQTSSGSSNGYPITIFFTAAGQICGMGMTHFGQPVSGLDDFWMADSNGDGNFMMTVTFRPASDNLCDPNSQQPELLGNQVVVNQGSTNFNIPLTTDAATQAQFTMGGCISDMGTHWSYDLKTHPDMSWVPSNFMPVVPMYNNGVISAFFFTTPILQYSEPFGPWEGPIPDDLMCLNWCSDSCGFGVNFWSVLHFFITDPSLDICNSRCNN